jgi:transposase-like protein
LPALREASREARGVKKDAALAGLRAIVERFADPDAAEAFVLRLRWPEGVRCPRADCGSGDVVRMRRRHKWRCRDCSRQFSAKVDTIFEDSPIGFDKWLPAIWVLLDPKHAVSSCELAKMLHITQKTAWSMLRRLRSAMDTQAFADALRERRRLSR